MDATAQKIMAKFVTLIIQPAVDVLFAAAFFLFVWGLVEFMQKINEGSDIREGKQHMVWGIVGMVIMVSVIGILTVLNNTAKNVDSNGFGIDSYLQGR